MEPLNGSGSFPPPPSEDSKQPPAESGSDSGQPKPQTRGGEPSEGDRLGSRAIKRSREEASDLREGDEEAPDPKRIRPEAYTPLPKPSPGDREAVSHYLQTSLACFRDAAAKGEYRLAYQYSRAAVGWMEKQRTPQSGTYRLLKHCMDGAEFICDINEKPDDWQKRWLSRPMYDRHPLNFLCHVLLDSGRLHEPDCEFDIPQLLDIFTMVGLSDQVHCRNWYIYFQAIDNLFQFRDFLGGSGRTQHTKGSKTVAKHKSSPGVPVGKLYDQSEALYKSFQQAVINNDEAAFDQLTQNLKKYCAEQGYHHHALFEAGALLASVHARLKRPLPGISSQQQNRFNNRILRIMNDFGLVLFGPGRLGALDLYRSVIALCKWRFPPDRARHLIRSSLEVIARHSERCEPGGQLLKDCDMYKKNIREHYATHYGRLISPVQDDIDRLLDQGKLDEARAKVSEVITEGGMHPGELNAIRLQLASCYNEMDDYDYVVEEILGKTMNRGFFGIKKVQLLLHKGKLEHALKALEAVKQEYSSKKGNKDLGVFEVQDILRLEQEIRQQMVEQGLLAKELYTDPMESADKISELETQLAQLTIDNTRLQRRVKARRLGYQQAEELAGQVKGLQATLESKEKELKVKEKELGFKEAELQKAQLQIQALKKSSVDSGQSSEGLSKKSGKTLSARNDVEHHKAKAKQYQRERDDLRVKNTELTTKLKYLHSEAQYLRRKVKEFPKILESSITKAKNSGPSLYFDSSGLQKAGQGVYAGELIKSGTVIGEYTGEKVYRQLIPRTGCYAVWKNDNGRLQFLNQDYYTIWIEDPEKRRGQVEEGIDAETTASDDCPLKLVNHNADNNIQIIVTRDNRVFAVACKDIKKDEELFWDYDTRREHLFELEGASQSALKKQDHIEAHPARYVKLNPASGSVKLTKEAKQFGTTGVDRLWD